MKQSTDHKGRKYASVKKMCEANGISYEVFNARILRGWSLEEALTIPEGEKRKRTKFEVESARPSVEYRRYLNHKLSQLNQMPAPQEYAKEIYALHQKITELDALKTWLFNLDAFLTGEPKLDRKTSEQVERLLDADNDVIRQVLEFDKEYHVSGYFEHWLAGV